MVTSIAGKLNGHFALGDTSAAKDTAVSVLHVCHNHVNFVPVLWSAADLVAQNTGGLHARSLMVTSFFLSRLDDHKQHLPHCTLVGLKMLSAKYFKGLL